MTLPDFSRNLQLFCPTEPCSGISPILIRREIKTSAYGLSPKSDRKISNTKRLTFMASRFCLLPTATSRMRSLFNQQQLLRHHLRSRLHAREIETGRIALAIEFYRMTARSHCFI